MFALIAFAVLPMATTDVMTDSTPEALGSSLKSTMANTFDTVIRLNAEVSLELELEMFEVIEPGATIIVEGADGQRRADLGNLRLWRGSVPNDPDSRVFFAVSDHFTQGYVKSVDGLFFIGNGPGGKYPTAVLDAGDMPIDFRNVPGCEIRTVDGQPPRPVVASELRGIDPGTSPCRVTKLAIETDWEYVERLYSGDADAAATYAVTLTGAISEIYRDDVNTRLSITYLRTWESDIDPYDPDSSTDMLDQFREHWSSQMSSVDRTLAHIITGRTNLPYGGVAYLSVLCNSSYGYGVSGYIEGGFPYPLQDNANGNWDVVVMAHELGHNHGTLHTHDGFTPPIDNCGNGDCAGADQGTIMSYCHTCSGGIANIRLGFHPLVKATMLDYMDDLEPGCDLQVEESGTALDDSVVCLLGASIDIDILQNDRQTGCDGSFDPQVQSFDATSVGGGTIELVDGTDLLRYQPEVGYQGMDTFGYQLTMGDSAVVSIDVVQLKLPDVVVSPAAGAEVGYYVLSAPSVLPDFDMLVPFATDVAANVDFASTGGEFMNSGLSDDVGAVFEGFIDIPSSGFWTLSVESDDGSRLFIGDEQVLDNDGLHGMVEVSGDIGLVAGTHAIRIDFFERGGGAGVIARWQGPGVSRQVIPVDAWSFEASDCLGDVNGDLVVGVDDILAVIDAWGLCSDCPEDVDGSGSVEVNDLLLILSAWATPC